MMPHRILWLALPLLAAGCAESEPYGHWGTWQETFATNANLAAMLDDPADLARGRGTDGASGLAADTAISRLREGKTAKLIDTAGTTPTSGSTSGSGTAGGSN